MIVHKATHFFDAKYPELEEGEEEIFYRHIRWPLQVNQLGIIFFDNEDDVIYGKDLNYRIRNKDKRINAAYYGIGPKARVCYECYHGVFAPGKHMSHIDGNSLNCTKENLMFAQNPSPKHVDPVGYSLYYQMVKANRLFVENTLDHMDKINQWVIKKGGDPDHYWELFGELPNWLQAKIRTRKKNSVKV